ncbi:type I-MYXAN CRISPR-associated protein Cas6/Cmx6 [Candidatus Thiosymbion oneisti]|uniref:type I-MYXAN CRISPR-associated protein Cas6/Cmx6 n=1 Tax=Candidatus Thiosymbion oneisti TaxID=589554 RepID=UPI000B7F5541|nr:type I-MYXAN CRISPR-associated protein Cas6/Cmx6 [Candidatus Thiosymbion oneisti]
MFWQEDNHKTSFQIPDDIVDVLFSLVCKRLPVDHAYALSAALQQTAPWIAGDDSGVAVHTVHVAGSQNGWERPGHGTDQYLILSKRTKLTIRVPKQHTAALIKDLAGQTLDVAGCPLTIGPGKIRQLSKTTTLLSRHVASVPDATEAGFLDWAAQALSDQGIRVRKALCGKMTLLTTPSGMLRTRSLMLSDLTPEESVRLQQQGLGPHGKLGCGIFIPHKGIEAVGKTA